ncbi:MFS transporter [Agrococcus sp. SL85]|uniref:MFS transporter n=1 Tax=Agrococcus sp. SL85 TaxID=2995141 RepID=UPI00226CF9E3|nr:MFS transporter [Agrococcus sp. SL85]WAC66737.1 MFS transporter [Agrococcus sp. SL85]
MSQEHPGAQPSDAVAGATAVPADGWRTFLHILINTATANLTTSFLWFALTFWVYLETESILATGIIGGAYMLFVAFGSILFGTIVDHHRKLRVMLLSSTLTLAAFASAGGMYLLLPERSLLDLGAPWFWLFTVVILAGAVIEHMRNIALSTTVTMLVPDAQHANANGLVGTVQGLAFIVTSVLSGFAIGFVGMGWTIAIAVALTLGTLLHLLTLRFPEDRAAATREEGESAVDLRGSIRAVMAVGGLFALIVFSTFNNLIGGVYMALMDPYGLELFSVQAWGIVFGVASTGFIVGGLVIARFGLGRRPMRTMLLVVALMGLLGALFTIREWWLLYAAGIWLYLCLVPAVEAAEQTVIQRVVPLQRQGRVFGFAMAFESAAAPITAFLIAPIAEFWIVPWSRTDEGAAALEPLLGTGEMRGVALVFLVAGLVMVAASLLAFLTPAYRRISASYAGSAPLPDADAEGAADGGALPAGHDVPQAGHEVPQVSPIDAGIRGPSLRGAGEPQPSSEAGSDEPPR